MALSLDATEGYGHTSRLFDLAFSPASSSRIASASEDGTARVWALDSDLGSWEQVSVVWRVVWVAKTVFSHRAQ